MESSSRQERSGSESTLTDCLRRRDEETGEDDDEEEKEAEADGDGHLMTSTIVPSIT